MEKTARITALVVCIVVTVQTGMILITGSTVCPTQACKIVEELTTIGPLGMNLMGLLYFLTLYWVLKRFSGRRAKVSYWPSLLLLAGLATEMVLFSFQLFVAKAFCLYCLFIFVAILFLNLLYGKKQIVLSLVTIGAILAGFAMINFKAVPSSMAFTLEEGVFGSRTCAAPTKKLYLIFSDECPHCLEVIVALEECNSCDLHLNPVEEVGELKFKGIVKRERFSPDINRQILSVLGIEQIPVLLVEHTDGFQFIQGERRIIDYVRHACFQPKPTFYLNRSPLPG